MVRVILYVKIADGFPEAAGNIEHKSLQNCKQLAFYLHINEMLVQIEGADMEVLKLAIIQDLAVIDGVEQMMTLAILKD
jgi:hypothetical protein